MMLTARHAADPLATEVALDALRGEVRAVVASTMQPTHVSIWMRAL